MDVIYLLKPTEESIDALLQDHSNPRKPLYSGVHLYFTTRVPDDAMAKIKSCGELLKVRKFNVR